MAQIEERLNAGDVEGAKTICRNTRGPIASICYQGLMRFDDGVEDVERSITAYGAVQAGYLEKDALGLPCLLLWHRHSGSWVL